MACTNGTSHKDAMDLHLEQSESDVLMNAIIADISSESNHQSAADTNSTGTSETTIASNSAFHTSTVVSKCQDTRHIATAPPYQTLPTSKKSLITEHAPPPPPRRRPTLNNASLPLMPTQILSRYQIPSGKSRTGLNSLQEWQQSEASGFSQYPERTRAERVDDPARLAAEDRRTAETVTAYLKGDYLKAPKKELEGEVGRRSGRPRERGGEVGEGSRIGRRRSRLGSVTTEEEEEVVVVGRAIERIVKSGEDWEGSDDSEVCYAMV